MVSTEPDTVVETILKCPDRILYLSTIFHIRRRRAELKKDGRFMAYEINIVSFYIVVLYLQSLSSKLCLYFKQQARSQAFLDCLLLLAEA
jgi:hypothetical protein